MYSPYPLREKFRDMIKRINGVKKDPEKRNQELPTLKFVGKDRSYRQMSIVLVIY